jgi:hypothetical protein
MRRTLVAGLAGLLLAVPAVPARADAVLVLTCVLDYSVYEASGDFVYLEATGACDMRGTHSGSVALWLSGAGSISYCPVTQVVGGWFRGDGVAVDFNYPRAGDAAGPISFYGDAGSGTGSAVFAYDDPADLCRFRTGPVRETAVFTALLV